MNNVNSEDPTRQVYSELGNFIPTGYQENYDCELSQSTVAAGSCGVGNHLPIFQNMLSQVDEKPKILLMGLRRYNFSDVSECSFIKFQIWDFPGHIDFCDETFQSEAIFLASCAIIFIIDAQCDLLYSVFLIEFNFCVIKNALQQMLELNQQHAKRELAALLTHQPSSDPIPEDEEPVNELDSSGKDEDGQEVSDGEPQYKNRDDDYHAALTRLHATLESAFRFNMNIKFEVFIHKVDCLSDDQKMDIQRDITQHVTSVLEDLLCEQPSNAGISIGFHLTTIYDHSIFEAFSKVVQKLIPYLEAFEHLLNIFITNSMVDKAFLFDVTSKIYLATDSNAVDMQTYELCCDMIDVVVDVAAIYT
ncbi:Ras-related GTP-binding protein C/D [Schistosoma bovis]|uniref:Ras-related GTP-binding protein C/D n=1 Tax=Schistosoma bovis TaxID=6184 RepID=A0A430Q9Q3_SCHBO|nr:Ras-related GTP-binding protein C/D [Schistosoma bovis]